MFFGKKHLCLSGSFLLKGGGYDIEDFSLISYTQEEKIIEGKWKSFDTEKGESSLWYLISVAKKYGLATEV